MGEPGRVNNNEWASSIFLRSLSSLKNELEGYKIIQKIFKNITKGANRLRIPILIFMRGLGAYYFKSLDELKIDDKRLRIAT